MGCKNKLCQLPKAAPAPLPLAKVRQIITDSLERYGFKVEHLGVIPAPGPLTGSREATAEDGAEPYGARHIPEGASDQEVEDAVDRDLLGRLDHVIDELLDRAGFIPGTPGFQHFGQVDGPVDEAKAADIRKAYEFVVPDPALEALRRRSGTVLCDEKLVSFLYTLMRDHVPAGVVEGLVRESAGEGVITSYCNGYLAQYAKDVADRLRS